jgi:hypothetical protein
MNMDRKMRSKNEHVKITDGGEDNKDKFQHSRKRLDDLSDDLSSIPSYDDARMQENDLDMDIDETDLNGMFNQNQESHDNLNETG